MSAQNGTNRRLRNVAVRCFQLFVVLRHKVQHGAQVLQVNEQQLVIIRHAKRNIQNAFLHIGQVKQARQQRGTHFGNGHAHGNPRATKHIPKSARAPAQAPILNAELRHALLDILGIIARLRHAGHVALDIGHKRRNARLGKAFGQQLQRNGFARARGARDNAMPVCLVQQQVTAVFGRAVFRVQIARAYPDFVSVKHDASFATQYFTCGHYTVTGTMKSQEATGADARGRVQGMGAISEGTGAKAEALDARAESAGGAGADAEVFATADADAATTAIGANSTTPESCEDCTYPTLFGEAQVFNVEASDGTPLRLLSIGDGFQSATFVGARRFEPPFAYCRALDCLFDALPQAHRISMLGGGAFSYPKHVLTTYPQVKMDVVEIDPAVIDIARRHFYLDELERECGSRFSVFACDGMEFLRNAAPGSYDAIINDCFAGIVQDAPLLSEQGLSLAKTALAPGGMYLLNGLAQNANDNTDWDTLDAIERALRSCFDAIVREPVYDQEFFGNINHIFIAR